MRKRKTVTMQLMARIIPMVALLMAVVMTVTILMVNTSVREITEDALTEEACKNEAVLDNSISENLSSMELIKTIMEDISFANDNDRLAYLQTTLTVSESIPNGVYMGDDKNRYLDGSLWVPDEDYVVAERDWYREGLTHEKFKLGSPYTDADTGQLIVSISSKAEIPGWGKTVIVGDMFLDQISEFISDLKIMDVGYSFVLSPEDDMIIAHKDTEYNGMALEEAGKKDGMIRYLEENLKDTSMLDHVVTVDNDGTDYMMVAEMIEGTNWYLVCCVPEAVVMDTLLQLLKNIGVIAAILSVVMIVILTLSIRKQMKPISGLTSVIERITSGDFSVEVTPKGNNEITTMSEKLKDFIETMRTIIGELTGISGQLGEQAENSAEVSGVLSDAAGVQSESMGQMNITVDELAHSIENIAESASSLSEAVNVVYHNGSDAEAKVNDTVIAAEKGRTDIEKVAKNMDKINASMELLADTVREVGASTEEINKITDMIGDIAGQTNLLSLNASIEAARAGESGRGFAVVADQIGTLANMSAESVKQIAELIGKINAQVANTVEQTGQSVEDIKESKGLVDISYQTFMEIYDNVMMTETNIKNVTSKIQEVDDVATNMAAITEEQSASTEEILATSENLYEQSQNIAENSHQIERMAEALEETANTIKEHMQRFTV